MNLPSLLRSTPFRIGVGYAALFVTSAALLLLAVYTGTSLYLLEEADDAIEIELEELAAAYRAGGLATLSSRIGERLDRSPTGSSIYLLVGADRSPLAGNLDGWPESRADSGGWMRFPLEITERPGRVHSARARLVTLPDGGRLLVGRDMYELDVVRRRILTPLAWGAVGTAAAALTGAVLLGRLRMRRLAGVHRALGEIMDGDLSRRLPVKGTDDDVDLVIGDLNRMLDAIENLVEDVRRVSDNIAHDLRTPLARLRNRLDALRRSVERDPALAEEVEGAIGAADGLLSTFNALLRIARVEAGVGSPPRDPVDLGTVLHDVVELYSPLAEERRQEILIDVPEGLRISGDRDLLFQALANLLDNAIKHTPSGGRIEARGRATGQGVELQVADDGPGIPTDAREKVFRRFFRLSPSRSTPGNGLGLSLVDAVARLHGGRARVEDNHPGARFVLELPRPETDQGRRNARSISRSG